MTIGSAKDVNGRSKDSVLSQEYAEGGEDSFVDAFDDGGGGGDSGLGFWILLPLARCFPALKDTP